MIFETKLSKKLKEGDYLGDITFISDETLIDEAIIIEGNKIRALFRNKKNDNINHHRTFKIKNSKISDINKYGIPIMFDKIIDGKDSNGNEISHFIWEIDPEVYKVTPKRKIDKCLGNKEIEFIEKVLEITGNDMIEYWSLDSRKDNTRIIKLERKYSRYKI